MPDYLVRRVIAENGCDLEVACVAYRSLPAIPGLVTGEPPEDQGLQLNLPNLPQFGSMVTPEETADATSLTVIVSKSCNWLARRSRTPSARRPPSK